MPESTRNLDDLEDLPYLLTPGEVSSRVRADSKTVSRWAKAGLIPQWACHKTPGGHWRFKRPWLILYLRGQPIPPTEPEGL